jgi:hypothetical protein
MKQPIKPQVNPINHARRGAMLVQIAIMMIGFMLAITFSIDSAQMQLTQTEMNCHRGRRQGDRWNAGRYARSRTRNHPWPRACRCQSGQWQSLEFGDE